MMTVEEMRIEREKINAERMADYRTLGSFLGLAEMAADGVISLEALSARMAEVLKEYQERRKG